MANNKLTKRPEEILEFIKNGRQGYPLQCRVGEAVGLKSVPQSILICVNWKGVIIRRDHAKPRAVGLRMKFPARTMKWSVTHHRKVAAEYLFGRAKLGR